MNFGAVGVSGKEDRPVPVSRTFRAAVKLADRPAWRIAYEAGLHPAVLSKLMSGAIIPRPNDPRVLAVARVLGLQQAECFESTAGNP